MRQRYLFFLILTILFNLLNATLGGVHGWRLEGVRFVSVQNLLINILLVMIIVAYWVIGRKRKFHRNVFVAHITLSAVTLFLLKTPFIFILIPQKNPVPADQMISVSSTILKVAYISFIVVQIAFALYVSTLFNTEDPTQQNIRDKHT